MSELSISFEDLRDECNFKNDREFRKVLKANRFNISRKELIPHDVANKVAERLINKKVNWYKLKQRYKETERGLESATLLSSAEVGEYFDALSITDLEPFLQRDVLMGVISSGGFFTDGSETRFVLKLQPGINVFIGDRGCGKSTALSMLGILADSVSEETSVLVTNLLGLLDPEGSNASQSGQRIYRTLSRYGINDYLCFYTYSHQAYCYHLNVSERAYEYFCYTDQEWMRVSVDNPVKPDMQVLQQGEVIRIAAADNSFYLNNILDALFPDLHAQRGRLAVEIKKFREQFTEYKPHYIPVAYDALKSFIKEREGDLGRLRRDIRQRFITTRSIDMVDRCVWEYKSLDEESLSKLPIAELIRDGHVLFYLYISTNTPLLSQYLRRMRGLARTHQQARLASVDRAQPTVEAQDDSEDVDNQSQYVQLIQQIREDRDNLYTEDDLDEVEINPADIQYDADESNLFLRYMEEQENNPVSRKIMDELIKTAEKVHELLATRLGVLKTCLSVYSNVPIFTEALGALKENYLRLLERRFELIRLQQEKCRQIAAAVTEDYVEIDVYTRDVENHEREASDARELFTNMMGKYQVLAAAPAHTSLKVLQSFAYKASIQRLFDALSVLRSKIESDENDFLFMPIEIDMRQGGIKRSFSQLSFGQKSSIILSMVFQSGHKSVSILDQPEDNLDAKSIVNTLARTLNRLSKDRQIIIATHNSNLVLGLDTQNLIILESLGETGRIGLQGSPLRDGKIIEGMIDVLEGGHETFGVKIDAFEEFVTRVRGQIRDIDMTAIESSFRRRTIDDLRNFLQPVVSDREILGIMRHEFSQVTERPTLQNDGLSLAEFVRENGHSASNSAEILSRLDKLLVDLSTHVGQLKGTIEDIRLMDTDPHESEIDLLELLEDVKAKLAWSSLLRVRKVRVDLDESIKGLCVKFDEGHLKLIFRNLINNSLRATELKALRTSETSKFEERVSVKFEQVSDHQLQLLLTDNGRGIPPEIRNKLYVERCTDQFGKYDGLGGVTIRKLLDLNKGRIQIVQTTPEYEGTVQRLILPLANSRND